MAKGSTTPLNLTPAQQDAHDALVTMKVSKEEAARLIAQAKGNDSGEILSHALRLRSAPRIAPPQGAKLQSVRGVPAAPVAPSQTQQIPGFGPPGGPQAAPNAQQLAQAAKQAPPPGAAPQPNWFWRLMGATPPPAPVSRAPQGAPAPPPQTQSLPVAQTPPRPQAPVAVPVPAPVKPRIRVRAAGGRTPETPGEAPKPQELPLISTQEEYDKLPIGARFKHPDGYIYRKESHSGEEQKLQSGGEVQGKAQQPKGPWEAGWEPTYEATEGAPADTDTVPAKLTPGEYVIPKPAVDAIGPQNLDALTAALLQKRPGAAAGSPYSPAGTGPGRTEVGPTGQTVDTSGHPLLRALAYGPNSEGATEADQRQVKGAWDQPLQPGDIAVSPNLLKMYPLKSRVNVVDKDGNIVLPNARVADTSWIKEGEPTTNTFEIWNGPSLGRGYHLVPAA